MLQEWPRTAMSVPKDELPNKAQINTSMEDRLSAAEHPTTTIRTIQSGIDVAHNIVKAIQEAAIPYYEDDEIIDDMLLVFEQQQHQYTIQTENSIK